ncbi:MAG: hypothetical protein KAV82_00820 [Phycisphaerae bacterium]|nr:hypothetical protein [Phycisphaerae bacterium]
MTDSASDAVVLTGCGWVTPFAIGTIPTVLAAAGETRHQLAADRNYWAIPEDRLADYPDLAKELRGVKGAWVTAVAFEHARREAGIMPDSVVPERLGLALGCGLAGQIGMIDFADEVRRQTVRFVSPLHFPQTVGNYIAGALARSYEIRGPNITLSSGVASGLDALIEGCHLLNSGAADVVFAGGTDCFSEELACGLSRPGVLLSEGAVLFVLERAEHARRRGAKPLATVTGYRQTGADGPTPHEADDHLVSVAGVRLPGAVVIEHWVGQCFAALGAAALGAAIGAVGNMEVPLADAANAEVVSVGRIMPAVPAGIRAVADADGAHLTTFDISIAG